ncbi:heavy metal transporter [Amycolatopsis sp. H6(2020)]|nr:heavy metal transporter [Amycolatopsis sp. H6(2020)]
MAEELAALPGAAEVDVDVAAGRVLVCAETTLAEGDVRAAATRVPAAGTVLRLVLPRP